MREHQFFGLKVYQNVFALCLFMCTYDREGQKTFKKIHTIHDSQFKGIIVHIYLIVLIQLRMQLNIANGDIRLNIFLSGFQIEFMWSIDMMKGLTV